MPTENRSSNTEMVSVPRKLLETIRSFHWSQQDCNDLARAKSRAELIEILTKPAPQHQGEPVGALLIDEYFDNREVGEVDVQLDSKVCEQLAEKYPGQSLTLYINPAPADPGEVERLRADLDECDGDRWKLRTERNTLRTQLAERDALLRESSVFFQAIAKKLNGFHDDNPGKWCGYLDDALGAAVWQQDKIDTALSASAEPQVES